MGQNNPFSFLSKVFGTSAGLNNSQYGETGNKVIDFARPALDFLGGAYQAHAANPTAGGTAIAGLGNMVGGLSRRNYMNQLQQQAMREYQDQRHDIELQRRGVQAGLERAGIISPNLPSMNYETGEVGLPNLNPMAYLSPEFINSMRQTWENADTNAGSQTYATTGSFSDYGSQANPAVMGSLLGAHKTQQGNASNYINSAAGLSAVQGGQGASLIDGIHGLQQNPAGGQSAPANRTVVKDPMFDNSEQSQVITGGINQTAPPNAIDMNGDPFALPTDIPTNVAAQQRAGLQDAQEAGQQRETATHNRATESLNRDIHDATVQNKGGYARYAPSAGGGSQPTETTVLTGMAKQMGLSPIQTMQLLADPENFFASYEGPGMPTPGADGMPSWVNPGAAASSVLNNPAANFIRNPVTPTQMMQQNRQIRTFNQWVNGG